MANKAIEYIEIKNYFSIESILIDKLSAKNEIYFLGENGDGKTILLQAIIFSFKGLNDGDLLKTFKQLEIFNKAKNSAKFSSFSIVKNKNYQAHLFDNSPNLSKEIFNDLYAYGINRTNPNPSLRENYEIYASLFTDNLQLYNPKKTLIHIQEKNNSIYNCFLELINDLLKDIKINIDNQLIDISYVEKNTYPLYLEQLSHGYKSLIVWLSDLVFRLLENNPSANVLSEFIGIVLVDEIGMHLHPKLEYNLVRTLRKYFENIQWIFTTHSPVVILGASKDAIVYKLYKENGITKISNPFNIETYSNKMISGFITSPLFDLPNAFSAAYEPSKHDLQTGNYIYDLIHEEVRKRLSTKPLQNNEIKDLIKEMLDNFEKTGKL